MSSTVQTLPQEMQDCENGLLFSELAKPKIINIALHALTKITQRSFYTASSQSKELEIVNHATTVKKQLTKLKLTKET